jgi:hypothetical protein
MLNANRHAQQPKSETLGLRCDHLPLHVKRVNVVDLNQVAALDVVDEQLRRDWQRVLMWVDGSHPQDVPCIQSHDARITRDELRLLLDAGHVEPTENGLVKATCNLFPVPELSKGRRRLIKHTKAMNDRFGKETLIGIKLIRAQDLRATVHNGRFAITLDFSAWFDQIPLNGVERLFHCFPFEGQWYRLTRLPMGQRQAVDVASTLTNMLTSFERSHSIDVCTYIDNIRFLGNNVHELIDTAHRFVMRAWGIGASINEVTRDGDALAQLRGLVHEQGEFLGVEFDYSSKRVRVGPKALSKLRLLYDAWRGTSGFTHQNFLALFGVIFFAMQVTRPPAADRFYALKEYSDVARRVQADPGILVTQYHCAPARFRHIVSWIEDTLSNPWVLATRTPAPSEAEVLLVTDASAWGWGALLWDWRSGRVLHTAHKWEDTWKARRTSTWSETEAIARALAHFFPEGAPESLAVMSDSAAAVGAFSKGRSAVYALNRAVDTAQRVIRETRPGFYHIEGDLNPADALSRNKGMGSKELEEATAQMRSIKNGQPSCRSAGGPV